MPLRMPLLAWLTPDGAASPAPEDDFCQGRGWGVGGSVCTAGSAAPHCPRGAGPPSNPGSQGPPQTPLGTPMAALVSGWFVDNLKIFHKHLGIGKKLGCVLPNILPSTFQLTCILRKPNLHHLPVFTYFAQTLFS